MTNCWRIINSSVLKGSAVLVAIGAAQDTETTRLNARKRVATRCRTAGAGRIWKNISGPYEWGGCIVLLSTAGLPGGFALSQDLPVSRINSAMECRRSVPLHYGAGGHEHSLPVGLSLFGRLLITDAALQIFVFSGLTGRFTPISSCGDGRVLKRWETDQ